MLVKGKGTHFGMNRVAGFIHKCSKNYTQDSYVLKLDIKGFFMHINKAILPTKIEALFEAKYNGVDKELHLNLCKKILFNNPISTAVLKGCRSNWDTLPKDKKLNSNNCKFFKNGIAFKIASQKNLFATL